MIRNPRNVFTSIRFSCIWSRVMHGTNKYIPLLLFLHLRSGLTSPDTICVYKTSIFRHASSLASVISLILVNPPNLLNNEASTAWQFVHHSLASLLGSWLMRRSYFWKRCHLWRQSTGCRTAPPWFIWRPWLMSPGAFLSLSFSKSKKSAGMCSG